MMGVARSIELYIGDYIEGSLGVLVVCTMNVQRDARIRFLDREDWYKRLRSLVRAIW